MVVFKWTHYICCHLRNNALQVLEEENVTNFFIINNNDIDCNNANHDCCNSKHVEKQKAIVVVSETIKSEEKGTRKIKRIKEHVEVLQENSAVEDERIVADGASNSFTRILSSSNLHKFFWFSSASCVSDQSKTIISSFCDSDNCANTASNITTNTASNVTPNVAANVSANVAANASANVAANASANVAANASANVAANASANVAANVAANASANVAANVAANVDTNNCIIEYNSNTAASSNLSTTSYLNNTSFILTCNENELTYTSSNVENEQEFMSYNGSCLLVSSMASTFPSLLLNETEEEKSENIYNSCTIEVEKEEDEVTNAEKDKKSKFHMTTDDSDEKDEAESQEKKPTLKEELTKVITICDQNLKKDFISASQAPILNFIEKCEIKADDDNIIQEEKKECLKLLYSSYIIRDIVDLLCIHKEMHSCLGKEENWHKIKCNIPHVNSYMRQEDPSVNDGKVSYTIRYKGILDLDPLKLLTVMAPEHTPKYDYMTESSILFHRYSEFHQIAYVVHNFRVPILSKRDWIFEYSLDASLDGRLSYAMHSINYPHEFVPREYEAECRKYVRANLIKCGGTYEAIAPNLCYFESFVNADIMFNVPSWLLRYITTHVGARLLEVVINVVKNEMHSNTYFGNVFRQKFPSIKHIHDLIVESQSERRNPSSPLHYTLQTDVYTVDKWSSELSKRTEFPLLDKIPAKIIHICASRKNKRPNMSDKYCYDLVSCIIDEMECNGKA